ncbi:cytochrome b/b6 domain-containing protein [Turicibacter bilis]|uniref:cytochrome b/b6 domain-containing protein n=1 Tax=Turicibacter bilis TaxID=2735723 RepID=UPI0031BBA19C
MVDLTKLSKEELIREFDIIILEWQKCRKVIQSCELQISELDKKYNGVRCKIDKRIDYYRRNNEIQKGLDVGQRLSEIIKIILYFIVSVFFIQFLFGFRGAIGTIIDILFFCGILLVIFVFVMRILWYKIKAPRLHKKMKELHEEQNFLIKQEKRKIAAEIEPLKENLKEKIQCVHANFNEIRKRNNLASKYYGYEHVLKDYLKSGQADNFKESILRLEEDWHRQDMVNVQRKLRAQINNANNQLKHQSNQLKHQSNQLARQSAQIDDLQREIDYLR